MIAVELPSIAVTYHLRNLVVFLVLVGLVAMVASRRIREVLTEEPAADIEGQVEAGEYRSTVRGMTS